MNLGVIGAIIAKDLRAYSRDRLWVLLSGLMLVLLVVIFWLLPARANESITLGISQEDLGALATGLALAGPERGALEVVDFGDREDSLRQAVAGELSDETAAGLPPGAKDVEIGIAFPPDFAAAVRGGRATNVTLFVASGVPPELRQGIAGMVRELAFGLAGQELPVQIDQEEIVLGPDRTAAQLSLRQKMRPLFAFLVLLVESFALASLIAEEIYARTATAILITPAGTADLLLAKAATGTLLAFGQAFVFLLAVRGWGGNNGALFLALLLGAVMAAAVGMLAGSAGRDFMATIFYGMIFFVPLAIPAFAGLFPGTASGWVRVLPSYGVVETIVGATAYGETWRELGGKLTAALVWDAALLLAGFAVLKRKVETL